MDKRLQILQALYGEGDDRDATRRLAQDDAALWGEYQALSEAKFLLDHRRRERPDPLVLDAVFAAAAGAVPEAAPRPRADRRPIPHRNLRFRAFGVVTAVLAVVMLATSGLWQVLYDPAPTDEAAVESASAPAPVARFAPPALDTLPAEAPRPESIPAPALAAAPTAAPDPAPTTGRAPGLALAGTATRAAAPPAETTTGAEPAADNLDWDASARVLEMHRRIEMLEAGVGLAWDEPAVPLEMLPAARPDGATRFQQAGQPAPAGRRQ